MSRRKGGRNRRKAQRYFESLGYLVANVEKTGSKFLTERDLFSGSLEGEYTDKGFDIVCLGKGSVILCQVKSNKPAVKKFYRQFAKLYADGYIEVLVATWIDYKGFRFQWYEPDGSITETFVESKQIP